MLLAPRDTAGNADHTLSHIRLHPYGPSPQSAAEREVSSEEPHLCVCTLGVPEALLICRHKTLPQKKLELLLVAVLS
jgi:hypothetical protein